VRQHAKFRASRPKRCVDMAASSPHGIAMPKTYFTAVVFSSFFLSLFFFSPPNL